MVDYSLNRTVLHKGGVKIKTAKNDINIFDKGKLAYNLGFYQNSINVNFSEFYFYNIKLQLGANIDHFYYLYELKNARQPELNLETKPYINYLLSGSYDNLNNINSPTKGMYFNFKYAITTNNFYQLEGKNPMQAFSFTFFKPIEISRKFTLSPHIDGRIIVSDTVPFIYSNLVGGQWDNQYVNQQISLQGLQGMEIFKKSVVKTQVNLKYNINKNHGVQLALNYTLQHDNPLQILKGNAIFGGSLGYLYNTLIGPITLRLSYSDRTKEIYPYISAGYYF
jgi:NTE family protein